MRVDCGRYVFECQLVGNCQRQFAYQIGSAAAHELCSEQYMAVGIGYQLDVAAAEVFDDGLDLASSAEMPTDAISGIE